MIKELVIHSRNTSARKPQKPMYFQSNIRVTIGKNNNKIENQWKNKKINLILYHEGSDIHQQK